jgi:DNA-nicking Smr family endonuclease
MRERVVTRRRPRRDAGPDPFEPLDGPLAATLDLHGFRAAEASTAVERFLDVSARHHPGGLVHIITGRGRGSPGEPVLKRTVTAMLRSGNLADVETWGEDLDGGGLLVRMRRR